MRENSNTSHVKVYHYDTRRNDNCTHIQIHLMLKFIGHDCQCVKDQVEIQIHLMLKFIGKWHLKEPGSPLNSNTSHVKVYHGTEIRKCRINKNSNTSHVKVYLFVFLFTNRTY